ncbi:MAG: HEAT repeat domain-containing protein, partial [Verrucomicrobiota bacterium]
LLPEQMRVRRAEASDLTIYEMIRNEELYPLETYLDAADVALAREPENLDAFVSAMSEEDEGLRWWAIVGLHLLEDSAATASDTLEAALEDEAHEIRMMAAWTLVKLGQPEKGLACLESLLFEGTNNETFLHNVLDWMGEPALPLVKRHIEEGGSLEGKYGISILGRVAELNGF